MVVPTRGAVPCSRGASKNLLSLWRKRREEDCPVKANAALLCEFFDTGRRLLDSVDSPSFVGWNGSHPSYKISYAIAPAGKKGLGAFTAQDVKAGATVYCDLPDRYISIVEEHTSLAGAVAAQFSEGVVKRAIGWCSRDYVCGTRNSVICEQDDGRYFNHDSNPSTKACADRPTCLCASRRLRAGDELTEDYEEDHLDTRRAHRALNELLHLSGSTRGQHRHKLCV